MIGAGVSVSLFLVSWWTHTFDFLVIPQLSGFLISSWLWGFPGFPHHDTNQVRGAFLFPYVMIVVNMVFYGVLAHVLLSFIRSEAVKPGAR